MYSIKILTVTILKEYYNSCDAHNISASIVSDISAASIVSALSDVSDLSAASIVSAFSAVSDVNAVSTVSACLRQLMNTVLRAQTALAAPTVMPSPTAVPCALCCYNTCLVMSAFSAIVLNSLRIHIDVSS